MNALARSLAGGIQAQGMRHAANAGLVSCSGSRTTACNPFACVEAAWIRLEARSRKSSSQGRVQQQVVEQIIEGAGEFARGGDR